MSKAPVHLLRDLLDHELVDCNGVSCGMVDDLEIDLEAQPPRVVAVLAGPGAWQTRLPAAIRIAVRALAGTRRVRVPVEDIAEIAEVIHLRSPATQLGLGVVDRRIGRWLRKETES